MNSKAPTDFVRNAKYRAININSKQHVNFASLSDFYSGHMVKIVRLTFVSIIIGQSVSNYAISCSAETAREREMSLFSEN